MALKRFAFEFDDESAAAKGVMNDGITFEYSGDESLSVEVIEGNLSIRQSCRNGDAGEDAT